MVVSKKNYQLLKFFKTIIMLKVKNLMKSIDLSEKYKLAFNEIYKLAIIIKTIQAIK